MTSLPDPSTLLERYEDDGELRQGFFMTRSGKSVRICFFYPKTHPEMPHGELDIEVVGKRGGRGGMLFLEADEIPAFCQAIEAISSARRRRPSALGQILQPLTL